LDERRIHGWDAGLIAAVQDRYDDIPGDGKAGVRL
jgi:hypothetical protein